MSRLEPDFVGDLLEAPAMDVPANDCHSLALDERLNCNGHLIGDDGGVNVAGGPIIRPAAAVHAQGGEAGALRIAEVPSHVATHHASP